MQAVHFIMLFGSTLPGHAARETPKKHPAQDVQPGVVETSGSESTQQCLPTWPYQQPVSIACLALVKGALLSRAQGWG
jgi:hypothetical protein